MASQAEIEAVTDAIVSAFGGSVSLFTAFLVRAKLETDQAQLESEMRQLEAAEDIQNTEYATNRIVLAEQILQKQAEIDALV